jgi:signal transduction histidine kinase
MRERAESIGAAFAIESTPGSGTSINVEFPLPAR